MRKNQSDLMKYKNRKYWFFLCFITILASCATDDSPEQIENEDPESEVLATVTTFPAEEIKSTSAKFWGKVTDDGGEPILERGFCWSLSREPTLEDFNISTEVFPNGNYMAEVNDLNRATTYYFRAYATNRFGTAYGEEQVLNTLDNYLLFTADRIVPHTVHNIKDKIIYLFTYKYTNGNENDFKVTAYNYETKNVVAQKQIAMYRDGLHSIAQYNDNKELYIFDRNSIHILDGVTLNEINTITVPQASMVLNAELLNNLLFITVYYPNGHNGLITMDRETFTIVDEHESMGIFGNVRPYINASNPDIINCALFPQYSNSNYYAVWSYNLEGHYIDFELGKYANEGRPIRYNENTNFILKGMHGRIYSHDNLMEDHPALNPSEGLGDYRINSEGTAIYAFQYSKKINKYNTTSFTLDKTMDIREEGKNIFVDGNQLIVLDYLYGLETTDVYVSFYDDL